jgi:hypothetical protein
VASYRAELVLVGRNRTPRVHEREKPVLVEALISHATVEALHARVLIRLARLNMLQDHPVLRGPDSEGTTDELGPVVTDDAIRSAARHDLARQNGGDGAARERRIDFHRQRLARAIVDDVQRRKHTARRQGIAHEVHRPSRVRRGRGLVRRPGAHQLATATLPDGQTGVPVDALDPLVIIAPALAAQLPRQQGHPLSRMIAGELHQAIARRAVVAPRGGDVAYRCPMHTKPSAGATLPDCGARLHRGDRTPPLLGGHQSFPATSLSTWIFSA